MIVWKNIRSEKHFILLEYTMGKKALFVTPRNEEKLLELRLFQGPIRQNSKTLLSWGLITKRQKQTHQQYMKARKEDAEERERERMRQKAPKKILEALQQKFKEMPAQKKAAFQKRIQEVLDM